MPKNEAPSTARRQPTPEEVEAGRRALEAFEARLAEHERHRWAQVGPCVWCDDCDVRLYNGQLPRERNPEASVCERDGHDWDDANSMCQSGFYFRCLRCGEKEWTD